MQREPDERALRVELEHDARDLADAHRRALLDADRAPRRHQLLAGGGDDLALDVGRHALGLGVVAVQEQPARALRHVAPHEQDGEAHDRGQAEREAPADVLGEDRLVEQQQRGQRAEDRADPVGAADDEVDGAAHSSRDQLVHGRADGRVLTADAGAGDRAAGQEPDDDRHRQAVEHPDRAEAEDHHPVPLGPRETVHPGRDVRLDGPQLPCVPPSSSPTNGTL
jgi:hypothetical protein